MSRFGLILIVCLAGCAASERRGRDFFFDRAWSEDAHNSEVQSRDEYLAWVASFYDGSAFVPGWTRRQADLCATLDSNEAAVAESRLRTLGRLLASEWAKDNRCRRVDTDDLIRVARLLSEARDEGRLIEAVDALLDSPAALISLSREP